MTKRKQVILLMTDTTRFDMLGCYGNSGMKTPNLDALAEDGIRFEHAYTCQPVCGPARSAIFTGTFPHSCGGFTNSYALGANVKTVGQRLRDNGIHTAYIGKYHLDGGDYFGLGRCPDGWDEEYWYDMRMYLNELTPEERVRSRQSGQNEGITEDFLYANRVCRRAVDFLSRYGTEDFFLVASLDEPHGPSLCPEPFASMYQDYEFPKRPNVYDTLDGKPDYQKVWAGERRFADRDQVKIKAPSFFGCNSYADYELGKVIRAAKQYAPDALIIYTSDHGDALQSHCLWSKGPAAYDEVARIPLIISGGKKGAVAEAPVSHINLVPTILEYMGLPIPKLMEGRSILPMLENPDLDINHEIYLEFTRYEVDHDGFGGFRPMRTVFDGRHKLSIHLLDRVDELYDLKSDPYEMKNLIFDEAHYEKAKELHEKLLNWMNETRDPFRGYDWERRAWRRDAREASWDYTGYTRQRENEEYEPRQLDYSTGLEMVEASRPKAQLKPGK